MKRLAPILGGLALLGGAVAPVIPVSSGAISVAVFQKADGTLDYVQQHGADYQKMGAEGGAAFNPKGKALDGGKTIATSTANSDETWLYSYQYPIASYQSSFAEKTATSTVLIVNPQPAFSDIDTEQVSLLGSLLGKTRTPTAHAAIAFDSYSTDHGITASSMTYAETVAASAEMLITRVVTPGTFSSVKYNAVSMTQIATTMSLEARTYYIFWLANPSTGTNNLVVTMSASTDIWSSSTAFSGVDQSNPINASGQASGISGSPRSISLTSTVANTWGYASIRDEDGTPTDGTIHIRGTDSITAGDSNGAFASIGSQTISYTPFNNLNPGGILGILLAPAAPPSANKVPHNPLITF